MNKRAFEAGRRAKSAQLVPPQNAVAALAVRRAAAVAPVVVVGGLLGYVVM